MTIFQLEAALNRYETALKALKPADGKPSEDVIVGVLIARDAVQALLTDITEIPQEKLLVVIQLDSGLREQSGLITQTIELSNWRTSFNPPKDYWWWFLEAPTHRLDHSDWVWNGDCVKRFKEVLIEQPPWRSHCAPLAPVALHSSRHHLHQEQPHLTQLCQQQLGRR